MALVPYIGDAESTLTKIIKMAGKSDEMMLETFEMVTKTDELKPLLIRVVDAVTGGKATTFISKGSKEEDLVHVAAQRGNFKETRNILRDILGRTRWLEKGDEFKGWTHIEGRHIEGKLEEVKYTTFFPIGQTISRNGKLKTLASAMDKTKVEELIYVTIKKGNIDPSDPYAYRSRQISYLA